MAEAQTTTTTAAATTTAAPNGEWHAGLDADTKGWIGGMGLDKLPADQALAKVLPMYRGAEQKLGIPADQILRLPGKDAKPEDMRAFYTKLGAPEKPEGYELPVPEGHDPEFAKTASTWFHELGIPKAAAAGLTAKWNEHVAAVQAKADQDWNARFDKEVDALKGEWKGDDFAKNTDLANRVGRAMGFAPDQLKAIERALGPAAFLKSFAKFGSAMGEHRFVGDGKTGFAGNIDDQIATLRRSPEYGKDSAEGRRISDEIYRLTQQDDRPANPVT